MHSAFNLRLVRLLSKHRVHSQVHRGCVTPHPSLPNPQNPKKLDAQFTTTCVCEEQGSTDVIVSLTRLAATVLQEGT